MNKQEKQIQLSFENKDIQQSRAHQQYLLRHRGDSASSS